MLRLGRVANQVQSDEAQNLQVTCFLPPNNWLIFREGHELLLCPESCWHLALPYSRSRAESSSIRCYGPKRSERTRVATFAAVAPACNLPTMSSNFFPLHDVNSFSGMIQYICTAVLVLQFNVAALCISRSSSCTRYTRSPQGRG
jgi:hypothetical protein